MSVPCMFHPNFDKNVKEDRSCDSPTEALLLVDLLWVLLFCQLWICTCPGPQFSIWSTISADTFLMHQDLVPREIFKRHGECLMGLVLIHLMMPPGDLVFFLCINILQSTPSRMAHGEECLLCYYGFPPESLHLCVPVFDHASHLSFLEDAFLWPRLYFLRCILSKIVSSPKGNWKHFFRCLDPICLGSSSCYSLAV